MGVRTDGPVKANFAGTVDTWSSVSISAHAAPRTSPELAAVSTRNSIASFTTEVAPDARTVSTTAATS